VVLPPVRSTDVIPNCPAPAAFRAPAAEPAKPAEPASEAAKGGAGLQEIQRLIRTTKELTEECQSAIKTCRATVEKARQQEVESPAIRLTPVAPPEPAPMPAPRKEREPEEAPRTVVEAAGIGWLQVALLAAAILAFPVTVLLLAVVLVRRTGLQFKVEVMNSGPVVARLEPGWPGAAMPAAYGPAPVAAAAPLVEQGESLSPPVEAPPQEPPSTAQEFDLGPTYEEERLAKEESLRQQELALLQQVFEDNCRLFEQLGALEDEAGAPTGSADEDGSQGLE
jgi:hypothetical protein